MTGPGAENGTGLTPWESEYILPKTQKNILNCGWTVCELRLQNISQKYRHCNIVCHKYQYCNFLYVIYRNKTKVIFYNM